MKKSAFNLFEKNSCSKEETIKVKGGRKQTRAISVASNGDGDQKDGDIIIIEDILCYN